MKKSIFILSLLFASFSYSQNYIIPCSGSEVIVATTDGSGNGHSYPNGFPISVLSQSGNSIYIKVTTAVAGSPFIVNTGLSQFTNMDSVLYNIGQNIAGQGWGGIFYKHGADVSNPDGDWSYWEKTVTVYSAPETTPPTASNLPNINVQCSLDVPAPDITVVADAADNCGTPTVTFISDVSDGLSCPETIIRTYKVEDEAGNSITLTQNISVNDITNPIPNGSIAANSLNINIPAGGNTSGWSPWVYSFTDQIPAGGFVTGIDLTFAANDQGWGGTGDNCQIYVAGQHIGSGQLWASPTNYTLNYNGTLENYVYGGTNNLEMFFVGYPGWQAFWQGGTLTIHYAFMPDITANCSVSLTAPTATDNCSTLTATTTDPTNYNSVGNYIVNWSFNDGCNIINISQNVVVNDSPLVPDITTLADVTACFEATPIAPTASDCAVTLTATPNVTFPITAQGTTVVTWTYDDGNGNIISQNQNVIINTVDANANQVGITLTATATGATYQWLDCTDSYSIIAGETNQTFVATANGSYAVEVTQSGCVDTSVCFVVTTVGINSIAQSTYKLYPNPVNNELTIESQGNIDIIEVYSVTGQLLQSIKSPSKVMKIDFSTYEQGMYLVKVYTTEGQVATSSIVKSK